MKLLFVASVLETSLPFGCTVAWWQLLKGLHGLGHEVFVTPYFGNAVHTPWWTAIDNPCKAAGQGYSFLKGIRSKFPRSPKSGRGSVNSQPAQSRFQKWVLEKYIQVRWRRHLIDILERFQPIDAVVFLTVPLNHLGDIPAQVRAKTSVPVLYYDGDLPASLPRHGGFQSGFSIYNGANVTQYDGFCSNSTGALEALKEMGVSRACALWWGADPEIYRPPDFAPEPEFDVFFYGLGDEYRREWVEQLVSMPSLQLPHLKFLVAGQGFNLSLGNAKLVPHCNTSELTHYLARSKIAVNIARTTHAECYATATTRIFELAAMGCAIVTNPMEGLCEWFAEDKELVVVRNCAEACLAYTHLADDAAARNRLAVAARSRVMAQHTYHHRALELAGFIHDLTKTRR